MLIAEAGQVFLVQLCPVGERLGRWLWRPGADLAVLLATVQRQGYVRLFSTGLRGELGSEIEVEISASGNGEDDGRHIALLLRDVTRRLHRSPTPIVS
ncbi:MAG: hypothetical protein ACXW3T_01470 [Rhodoplanes sp.]